LARHVGEIRLFVSEPFRGLGLGSALVQGLLDLALDEDLQWLQVEVMAGYIKAVDFFRAYGFEIKALPTDYFIDGNRRAFEVGLMLRPVPQYEREAFPEVKKEKAPKMPSTGSVWRKS